jgi:hypothetical protein
MKITNATIKNLTVKAQTPAGPIVSTPLFDATSENNWTDLQLAGNPTQVGNYLVFTGSEFITTTPIDTTTLTNNDYTYEFWVRTTGSNNGVLLIKQGVGGYTVSAVEISATTLVPGYWTGSSSGYEGGNPPITRDAWQHYVVTYITDGALKTYYNGALVNTSNFSPEVSPRDYGVNPIFFDMFTASVTNFGNGSALTADFGEFRLYTRALSDAEVLQNFQATRGRWGI